MPKTIGAKVTTLKSSHVPQQSQPEKVVAVITGRSEQREPMVHLRSVMWQSI